VRLADTGADGFIPASTLGRDYYRFVEEQQAMVGDRTGETVRARRSRLGAAAGGRAGGWGAAVRAAQRGQPRHRATFRTRPRGPSSKHRAARRPAFAAPQEAEMTVEITGDTAERRELLPAIMNGLRCRCPKCGEGKLFRAYLKVNDTCSNCGEEFFHHKADDLPPYISIIIVGHVIVGLMLHLEMEYSIAPDLVRRDHGADRADPAARHPALDQGRVWWRCSGPTACTDSIPGTATPPCPTRPDPTRAGGTPLALTIGRKSVVCAQISPGPCVRVSKDTIHGQSRFHQDQARLDGGYRVLLRDQEELAHPDREAQLQEVRPGRAQARRVQGIEDQVSWRYRR
jgi:uncharacterized protein (DUF983 family)